jgi:inner membrane protein
MMKNTHILGGIVFGIVVNSGLKSIDIDLRLVNSFFFIGGSILGASLPDLDCKLRGIIKHRSFTHSIMFCMMPFYVFLIYRNWFFAGISTGIISHITLDMLNKSGVSLLYPLKKRISFPMIDVKLNGKLEYAIRVGLIFFIVFSLRTLYLKSL